MRSSVVSTKAGITTSSAKSRRTFCSPNLQIKFANDTVDLNRIFLYSLSN
ncbi:hypothetical protein BCEP4_610027 [Burkholderia cepacia]|nr:hypothetical protein BCEP4_610027 [Burkholderia cepacia]